MADFRLETDRLVLRDWSEDDCDPFVRLTNTPAVMRWLGGAKTDEISRASPARFMESARQFGHCFWAVERRSGPHPLSGELLGFCGLKRTNIPGASIFGEFEIGWRLREDVWGQGFAREAAEASLKTGFEQFGASRINAITVMQNSASWGLMERLGMVRMPALDFRDDREDEEIANLIVYSITHADWQSSSNQGRT
jgi:RimJ/RimL family protein N-acetyltransferase